MNDDVIEAYYRHCDIAFEQKRVPTPFSTFRRQFRESEDAGRETRPSSGTMTHKKGNMP